MRIAWLLGFSLFVSMMATSALALKIDTLYTGRVPVTTQAAAERAQATQQALIQVLVKVSGNDQILNNPQLKARVSSPDADTLIQQYSYITPPTGTQNAPYVLEVQFDPTAINQWLRDAHIAIWGQNRPLIMAWILYESPGHAPEILSSDLTNETITLLKQNADKRGLQFILPVMDMTDINQTSAADITTMDIPKLVNATKRYASDGVLIGHITQNKQGFVSQWKLVLGDKQWNLNLTGNNLTDIMPVIVNKATNTLASRFAIVTTNTIQKDLVLKVTGITHYRDFAQLTRYLHHLTPVANVEITKILTDNDVILKVSLRSTQEAFTQALSLGKKLTPVPMTDTTDTMVVYQWNP